MPFRHAFEFERRQEPRAERPLPDYTWPQRMPIEQLRRTVERELNEAAEMAAQVLPHWREHRA